MKSLFICGSNSVSTEMTELVETIQIPTPNLHAPSPKAQVWSPAFRRQIGNFRPNRLKAELHLRTLSRCIRWRRVWLDVGILAGPPAIAFCLRNQLPCWL